MIISLDLDGTLLDSNKNVPKSTLQYLNELKQNGEIIVINSGRCLKNALKVTENACFANYIITDTGAVIYEAETQNIIRKICIRNEDGYKLFKKITDNCTSFAISNRTGMYFYPNDFKEYEEIVKEDTDIFHISMNFNNQEDVEKFANENKDKFPELKIFAMLDSVGGTKKWIEIINKKAGKFQTLLELANILNMKKEDIISFGDAINDLEMIQNSGIGVAMKNAIPEIRKKAKIITNFSNDECGVEKWLREFYENRRTNNENRN